MLFESSKRLPILVAALVMALLASAPTVHAQCPRCGGFHGTTVNVNVAANGGTFNTVDLLNRQRALRGLYPLRPDPALQAVAERRARIQANRRARGYHVQPLGHSYAEGIGWTSSSNPTSVRACFVTTTAKTRCGCAMVRVPGGGCYFALIVQ